ncbi:MAG: class I SAM-dependent methyltransferase [Anaerolineae bacterium]|nr:class I SAM-dependent methyltransferase [Anaerolineae bacterium]
MIKTDYEKQRCPTQQPKIEILRRKKVKLPQELVFAPIDFDKQDICEVLSEAGYQPGQTIWTHQRHVLYRYCGGKITSTFVGEQT